MFLKSPQPATPAHDKHRDFSVVLCWICSDANIDSPAIVIDGQQLVVVLVEVFGLADELAQVGDGDLPGGYGDELLPVRIEQRPAALIGQREDALRARRGHEV